MSRRQEDDEEWRREERNAIIQEGKERRILVTIGENACVLVEGLMHMCRDRRTMWLQYGTGCTNTVQKVIAAPSLKHDKMNLSAAEKSSTQYISPRLCSVLFSSTQFNFILCYSLLFSPEDDEEDEEDAAAALAM